MITNYLSPLSFTVMIDRLPNVEFFTQKVMIPGVTGNPVQTEVPLGRIFNVPQTLSYGDLDISFIVDEDLKNYLEILNWLEGIASPETTNQYQNLASSEDGIKSDITVLVNNSHKNPNHHFKFKDCFPVGITSLSFDVTQTEPTPIEVTATFRYTNFTVASHS